mmetsp:Transcript_49946/g.128540  ORF Transcript_49946/g.128540 Transcript_49946/m.128540 type:complete len:667 (-) Transcript_49946:586-2586(-)
MPLFLPSNRMTGYYSVLFSSPQEFVVRLACLFLRTWNSKTEECLPVLSAQEVLVKEAGKRVSSLCRGYKARKMARTLRRARLLEITIEETERLEAFGLVEKGHPVPSSLNGNGVFLPFGRRVSIKKGVLDGYHQKEMSKMHPTPPVGDPSPAGRRPTRVMFASNGEGGGSKTHDDKGKGGGKAGEIDDVQHLSASSLTSMSGKPPVPPLNMDTLEAVDERVRREHLRSGGSTGYDYSTPHSAPSTLHIPLVGADSVITPSNAILPMANANATSLTTTLNAGMIAQLQRMPDGVEVSGHTPAVSSVKDILPEHVANLSARGVRRENEILDTHREKEVSTDYIERKKRWKVERDRELQLKKEVPFVIEANKLEVAEFAKQKQMELEEAEREIAEENLKMKMAVAESKRRQTEIKEMMKKSKEEATKLISDRASEEKTSARLKIDTERKMESDKIMRKSVDRVQRGEVREVKEASREFVMLLARQHNYLGKKMVLDKIEERRAKERKEIRQKTQTHRLKAWRSRLVYLKTKTETAAKTAAQAREQKKTLKSDMERVEIEYYNEAAQRKYNLSMPVCNCPLFSHPVFLLVLCLSVFYTSIPVGQLKCVVYDILSLAFPLFFPSLVCVFLPCCVFFSVSLFSTLFFPPSTVKSKGDEGCDGRTLPSCRVPL